MQLELGTTVEQVSISHMTPDGRTVRIQVKDAQGNVGWTTLGEKTLKEIYSVKAQVTAEDLTYLMRTSASDDSEA